VNAIAATGKGAATREAILERAHEIAARRAKGGNGMS